MLSFSGPKMRGHSIGDLIRNVGLAPNPLHFGAGVKHPITSKCTLFYHNDICQSAFEKSHLFKSLMGGRTSETLCIFDSKILIFGKMKATFSLHRASLTVCGFECIANCDDKDV